MKKEDFDDAVNWALTWTWMELNKVRNGILKQSLCLAIESAQHMADSAARLVALVNRRYFRHSDCRYLDTLKEFEKLPKDFIKTCLALYTIRDLHGLLKVAEALWANCLEFVQAERYMMKRYKALQEIYRNHGLG